MITINASDNGRDQRLFGPPSLDLSHWLKAACWSLEEAVAISLGYEPDRLCLGLMLLKCPEEIRDRALRDRPQVFFRLSSVAQMYMGRLSLLERAVKMDELPAKFVNGEYNLKPFDFLRWFDAQTAEDWNFTPVAMTLMLEALTVADAEKKAPADNTRRRQGRGAALNYLIYQMRKSSNCPLGEKRLGLRKKIMNQFNISKHDADAV